MESHLDEIHEKYYLYNEAIKIGDIKKATELWKEVEELRIKIANGNT
jgi:selenocysteine lyase/cysteine desulfurase